MNKRQRKKWFNKKYRGPSQYVMIPWIHDGQMFITSRKHYEAFLRIQKNFKGENMIQGFTEVKNTTDENGNPTGGHVYGNGIKIDWQNGPLGIGEGRKEPNGAFTEDVIIAAKQRLEFFQESKFNCPENAAAIDCLNMALASLESRTKNRVERQVEGTHTV